MFFFYFFKSSSKNRTFSKLAAISVVAKRVMLVESFFNGPTYTEDQVIDLEVVELLIVNRGSNSPWHVPWFGVAIHGR
jgi:hypothetical protein